MTNLLNQLATATQELKSEYINSCEIFAEVEFNQLMEMLEGYRAHFKGEREETKKALKEQVEKYYTYSDFRDYKSYNNKIEKAENVKYKGLADFKTKASTQASKHFENSLLKLEARIIKKGLELEGLTLESGYVDQNFNCLITDVNGKQVKAQTILAFGEIQKPHFRYLVK